MSDELDRVIDEVDEITTEVREEENEEGELLDAVMEALELAEELADTEGHLTKAGVESKGSRTFARRIAELAKQASGEAARSILEALAVVVSRSGPEEWAALASILKRVTPKSQRGEADKIAGKMKEEGRVGYAAPQGYYPELGKKSGETEGTPNESVMDTGVQIKAILERLDSLDSLAGEVKTLAATVSELQEKLGTVSSLIAQEAKSFPAATRETPGSPPVAALLVGTLSRS